MNVLLLIKVTTNPLILSPLIEPASARQQQQIRARHEIVNGMLKRFSCLHSFFRHSIEKHPSCFFAIAHIVELIITHDEPLYLLDI